MTLKLDSAVEGLENLIAFYPIMLKGSLEDKEVVVNCILGAVNGRHRVLAAFKHALEISPSQALEAWKRDLERVTKVAALGAQAEHSYLN